ncbi:hypothetical protein LD004_11525, partial [Bacteroides xylanisolvens]|nr:hypothetical protein [Bacteroides xylanisolvens]
MAGGKYIQYHHPCQMLNTLFEDICVFHSHYCKQQYLQCNHTIFRHANFIGCLSADKIKMPVR